MDILPIPDLMIPPGYHAFIAVHFTGPKQKKVMFQRMSGVEPLGEPITVYSCPPGPGGLVIMPNAMTIEAAVQVTAEMDTGTCMQPLGVTSLIEFDGRQVTLPIRTSTALFYSFTAPYLPEPTEPIEKIGIVIILQEGVELGDPAPRPH